MTSTSSPQGFASGLLTYSSAALAAGILGLISAPITTRIFDPTVLGQVGVFSAYLGFLQLLILAGFDQGYMRFAAQLAPLVERQLLQRCLKICFVIGVAMGACCLLLWQPLSQAILGERSLTAAALVIVAGAGSVIYRFGLVTARSRRRPLDYFVLSIVFAISTKYLIVLAGLIGGRAPLTITMLAVGYLIAAILAWWTMTRTTLYSHEYRARESAPPPTLIGYSLPFLGTGLLSWGSVSVMPILIHWESGYEAVGQFNAGLSIVAVAGVIQVAVLAFWMPFSFATFESGPDRVRLAQQALVFIIIATGCLFIIFSGPLSLLLGPEFRQTSQFLGLLVGPTILTLLGEVCGVGLLLGRRSGLYALSQGAGTVVTLGLSLYLLPRIGLMGVGVGMSVGALCTLVTRVALSRSFFRPLISLRRAIASSSIFVAFMVVQSTGASFLANAQGVIASAVGLILVTCLNLPEAKLIFLSLQRELGRLGQRRRSHG